MDFLFSFIVNLLFDWRQTLLRNKSWRRGSARLLTETIPILPGFRPPDSDLDLPDRYVFLTSSINLQPLRSDSGLSRSWLAQESIHRQDLWVQIRFASNKFDKLAMARSGESFPSAAGVASTEVQRAMDAVRDVPR